MIFLIFFSACILSFVFLPGYFQLSGSPTFWTSPFTARVGLIARDAGGKNTTLHCQKYMLLCPSIKLLVVVCWKQSETLCAVLTTGVWAVTALWTSEVWVWGRTEDTSGPMKRQPFYTIYHHKFRAISRYKTLSPRRTPFLHGKR